MQYQILKTFCIITSYHESLRLRQKAKNKDWPLYKPQAQSTERSIIPYLGVVLLKYGQVRLLLLYDGLHLLHVVLDLLDVDLVQLLVRQRGEGRDAAPVRVVNVVVARQLEAQLANLALAVRDARRQGPHLVRLLLELLVDVDQP